MLKKFYKYCRPNKIKEKDEESSSGIHLNTKDESQVDGKVSSIYYVPEWLEEEKKEKVLAPIIVPRNIWEKETKNMKMLLWGMLHNNEELLRNSLKNETKTDLNEMEVSGNRLLHLACHKRDQTSLRILLQKALFPEPYNVNGLAPLHLCVHLKWEEGVKTLLANGASPDILPQNCVEDSGFIQESAIFTAARLGNKNIMENLLKFSKPSSAKLQNGNTLLHLAASSRNFDTVNYLMCDRKFGKDVNSLNNKNESPLHALLLGKCNEDVDEDEILGVAKLLLHHQAEINLPNVYGKTPLYLAALSGLSKVVTILLESGADPYICAKNSKNVIHAACFSGNAAALNELLKIGMMDDLLMQEDAKGSSPFHIAAMNGAKDCCLLLLKYGDHLTHVDSQGVTRFCYAMENMNNANVMIKEYLDNNIHIYNVENEASNATITLNFGSILSDSGSEEVQNSIVSEFAYEYSDELIVHPVVESFIYLKWRKILPFFYLHVLLYIGFLILHSYYIIITYVIDYDVGFNLIIDKAIYDLHIVFLTFLFLFNFVYIIMDIPRHMKQFETYFILSSLIMAVIVVFSKVLGFSHSYMRRDVAGLSIFLIWIEFMMLIGRVPEVGVYVLMFTKVASVIIRFLLSFLAILIAFTFALAVIFHHLPVFNSLPIAFVKVLMMMVGELDYNDFSEDMQNAELSTKIIGNGLLVAFVILIPILLANLLIGLAVSDLPDLKKQGQVRRLMKQASYIVSYERLSQILHSFNSKKSMKPFKLIMEYCKIDREIRVGVNKKNNVVPRYIIDEALKIKSDFIQRENNMHEYYFKKIKNEIKLFKCFNAKQMEKLEKKLMNRINEIIKHTDNK